MYNIGIFFKEANFEYDVHSLVKSFYPESQIKMYSQENLLEKEHTQVHDLCFFISCQENLIMVEGKNGRKSLKKEQEIHGDFARKEIKNIMKRLLYDILSEMTGTSLLWGTLSGIRPTKIAMKLLEEGKARESVFSQMKKDYLLSDKKANLCIDIAQREREILQGIDYQNGYSLYVGIPFCPTICLYCSFSSYPLGRYEKMVDTYLDALCKEIDYVAAMNRDKNLDTIYIGGGTPTTLNANQLRRLFQKIADVFDCSKVKEYTVEAGRPDSIDFDKLQAISEFPISRISVNPQTMNQKTLDLIGRKHSVEDTIKSYELARSLGFDNINMDLIVGLPGETKEDIENTLFWMKKLSPDSLTVHSLAVKRAARLNIFKDVYKEMSYENNQEIIDLTMKCAKEMDMFPYYLYRQKNMKGNLENVGYAKVDKAGIYNILIMEEKQTIWALGAGASTKIVSHGGEKITRIENVKDVGLYIEKIDEMILRKKNSMLSC